MELLASSPSRSKGRSMKAAPQRVVTTVTVGVPPPRIMTVTRPTVSALKLVSTRVKVA